MIGDGAIVMKDCGENTFTNCFINGVPMGVGGKAVISNKMSGKQLRNTLGRIPVSKEFERVEFVFDGTLIDARKLINDSRVNIQAYIEELRRII
ncbi:hypothetical protein D3C84_807540 [compost metagenome]